MRRTRITEQALKLAIRPSAQHYVCRACLARTTRQIHTSIPRAAELPFFSRLKNSILGEKKPDKAVASPEKSPENTEEAYSQVESKVIKGEQYDVAAVVNPKGDKERSYIPAATWDNLPRIGSEAWVKAQIDQGEQYTGFLQKKPVKLDDEEWLKLLHNVVVEVLTLKRAKRGAVEVCGSGSPKRGTITTGVKIVVVQEGKLQKQQERVSLEYPGTETEERILETIPSTSQESPQQSSLNKQLGRIKAQKLEASYDVDSKGYPSWMHMSLSDPDVKFAIVKRLMMLTSHRIPDAAITKSSTLAGLYDAIRTKEPPKKLHNAEELQELKSSPEFPNVTVYAQRRTSVHKEQDVGRWKIIEKELQARDLPVFGRRHGGVKQRLVPM